jgi:hypothetical protein
MLNEKSVKSEQEPIKSYPKVSVPRIREVTAEVRMLIEDLRAKGISDSEILIGTIAAIQAAPVTKALSQNPEVKAFLDKIGTFVRSGLDLLDVVKK